MDSKPHAVCIPYPAQSHIKAMLKLAKLLHNKGIHITFINTEYNKNRFLSSCGPDTLAGLPDFRFEAIPDGLPPTDSDGTQDLAALCEATRTNFLGPFMDIIRKLNGCGGSPPVTCIISDGFMGFTLDAGQQLGIPVAFFWTLAGCGFLGFYQVCKLIEKGLIPLKDESYLTNDLLNRTVDWVPDKNFIRFKDLPSFIRTTNPEEVIFKFTSEAAQNSARASANILHTFKELEPCVTSFLSSIFPQLYTVGPLELLVNNISGQNLLTTGYSLWKEDPRCTEWLNCKKPNSVVYVNFGSIAIMSPEKMAEFGWGLANSEINFLWVIRPDLIEGKFGVLPPKFFEIIKEKGFIASWCDQEEVLNHSSVGGFLTHCGWNSTIESLSAGVPMICLPFFGDQMTNCRYICTEWEAGVELDSEFERKDVEIVVRELMEGEKGRILRNKVIEWKKIAIKASGKNGSSSLSLDKFVNKFLCH